MKLPSEDIQSALKTIIDRFRSEDKAVRERQLRMWKRLKFMWEGFQHVWWNEVAHDWRIYDLQNLDANSSTGDASYYDKQANIFKALLESIIAALSVNIPGIIGVPDDADNVLDMQTAKAARKIASLIAKHNDIKLLWLHSLYICMTEGLVCAYNYPKEDLSYGHYDEPKYEDTEVSVKNLICPNCKTNIASIPLSNEERDEYDPSDDDVVSHNLLLNKDENLCPQCLMQVDPEFQEDKMIVPRFVGYIRKPKARQCIESYGGLYIKVPNYATCQAEIPYLCFSKEIHYSFIIEEYAKDDSDLSEKIRNLKGAGFNDAYERWARLSPQYMGEYPLDTPTLNQWWLRPASYATLSDDSMAKKLRSKFPDGCKVVMVYDTILCVENESLDDHWTLTYNPLTSHIHHEPLGEGIVPMQEVLNEMINLILQTTEHGIPQTFADPGVLNFEAYSQLEATPGMVIPTKPLGSSKSLQDGFYEVKTATLSQEVMPFVQFIQDMAQMVSGALPSLWGGAQPNSSKTASQYSMARSQALQRLQNQWDMFRLWWKNIHGKVIPAFIECTLDDERFVEKDEQGNFINVFIRKAELQGKLGSIELEGAEQLPISWAQMKDVVMQLLSTNNPLVQQAMAAPENLALIKSAIGIEDFVVPGEDDREKQYEEILLLVNSAPIQNVQLNPQTGTPQPTQEPSVEVDPFDNHQVHAEICKEWLVSEPGRLCKIENQPGYMNVLLHWQKHNQIVQQAQMQSIQMQEAINQSKVSSPRPDTNPDETQPFIAPVRQNVIAQ